MAADIQSMIEGIPSNYDAELFQLQVPDPRKSQSTAMYNARVDLLENNIRKAIHLTVAAHKGTNRELPEALINAMYALGVDPDYIEPMSEEEYMEATAAHRDQMRAEVDLYKSQDPTPDRVETPAGDPAVSEVELHQSVMDKLEKYKQTKAAGAAETTP